MPCICDIKKKIVSCMSARERYFECVAAPSSGNQRLAPTFTSHTLEAIQDTISDFFAKVG